MNAHDVTSFGTTSTEIGELTNSLANTANVSLTEGEGLLAGTKTVKPAVLTACRSALVRSPAASRIALTRHGTSIDSTLKKALEVVGGYNIEFYGTPLHKSVRLEDAETTQCLLAAGARMDVDDWNEETPFGQVENGDTCHALYKHHTSSLAQLSINPKALVSAAVAHCATLSSSNDSSVPAPALSLHAYQLDPSFLWAPREARFLVFKWARNAFVAQLAAMTQPFVDLPDDCAGDVLDYLEMAMTREESLCIAEHCSSPEANAWVHAANEAAMATIATASLLVVLDGGDLVALQDSIRKGADVDEKITEDGHTALIETSYLGSIETVQLLLEAGADTNIMDNEENFTALMHASKMGFTAIVELLLQAGADVNLKNESGCTALSVASLYGHTEITELLVEAGAYSGA